jgi:enoyl-CoA hydratase
MTEVADPSEDELLVEVADRAMVISINRPGARNAMTIEVAAGIAAALDEADGSSDIAVVILTGTSGTFCAGMDLKRLAAGQRAIVPGRGFGGLVEAPPRKPLIAAVEGWALGGGFELVLACDMAVCGRSARFGLPEVKRGLIAAAGGAVRLTSLLPRAIALEVLLTGEPLTAEKALHFGLVNRVVDDGAALDEARALARQIAANAPLALVASKQIAAEARDWPSGEIFARQRRISDPVFASNDAAEGARAFAAKRSPTWTGT